MRLACTRVLAAAAVAAFVTGSATLSAAQNADPKGGAQKTDVDGQKKLDEFADAAKNLEGPAANPECVWLGRRVVSLLWRDDLDTAFRHLDLYDRFGCPSGHIQATFRCLVRQGSIDPKAADGLAGRVHSCWINPSLEAASPQPSASAPATTTNR